VGLVLLKNFVLSVVEHGQGLVLSTTYAKTSANKGRMHRQENASIGLVIVLIHVMATETLD